jgi:hypothetical protein
MRPDLQRAWLQQAQLDAERGVIQCRMCCRHAGLDETTTLWRDGMLVFALCDRCSATHEVVFTPSAAGVEVRARSLGPLILQPVPDGRDPGTR